MIADAVGVSDLGRKARVLIACARDDTNFASQLEVALSNCGFEVLVDRTSAAAFDEWWRRVEEMLTSADAVLFVVSSDTLASEIVMLKLSYAASANKRLAPLLIGQPKDISALPREIRLLNFLVFDEPSRYAAAFTHLAEALQTDIGWIKRHTDIGEAARRWHVAGRPAHLLLSLVGVAEVETWIDNRPSSAPEPTEQMLAFIAASRTALTDGVPSDKSHVFVSFSHHDQSEALSIVHGLEESDIKCWISSRDVPRGEDFQDSIVAALEQANAMVLVFSKNADNSKEIKKELALASEHGLLVLPVRIENAAPTKGFKYQLATRQYIDLFVNREQNMALIVDTLRRHFNSSDASLSPS